MDRFARVVVVCAVGAAVAAIVLSISRRKRERSSECEKNNLELITPPTTTSTTITSSQSEASLHRIDHSNNSNNVSFVDEYTIRGLFGGAIQCLIPSRCSDVEQFRQVPDHQFVYEDPALDQSIIVEINTYQDQVSDSDCALFFWNNLLEDTDAKEDGSPVSFHVFCPDLPDYFKCGLIGLQQVSKYRDEATNTVQVCMAVIRLKQYTSDICIFVNTPLKTNQNSSTAGLSSSSESLGPQIMNKVLESFEIKDYSLFG